MDGLAVRLFASLDLLLLVVLLFDFVLSLTEAVGVDTFECLVDVDVVGVVVAFVVVPSFCS